MSFDPVAYAQSELAPLLRALCALAETSEQTGQQRFFASVLAGIEQARDGEDLADPFMQLSMSAFMGFLYDSATALLLDQLLGRAQRLAESLALDEAQRQ
ncbi:MAG: hypothetical protein R3F35_18720 [Myxococcota bacterium]